MGSHAADLPERRSPEERELPDDIVAPVEREQLVAAMAALCAERGYAEVRVEEVLDRAGVSRYAFEENFAGLEDCGLAAINQILAEATAVASAAWSADSSERESLVRGVRAILELMAAKPSFAHMAYIQSRQGMSESAFDLYESGMQVMAAMLDRLRGSASKEAPPASAARGALGSAELVIRRELVAGRPECLPGLLPDIIYGALVPFLGQAEALRVAQASRRLVNQGGKQGESDG